MHDLPLPVVDDAAVFASCVSVKAKALRDNFEQARPALEASRVAYHDHAQQGTLVQLSSIATHPLQVSGDELRALYNNQFVNKLGPARATYEQIRLSSERCPFCSHRPPKSVDHYLPKETFAEFSVVSLNLVPCCRDCNSDKHARVLTDDEQFVHPYYDLIGNVTWLECVVSYEVDSPVFEFVVNEHSGLPDALRKKMNYQMGELELSALYALQAVDEVGGALSFLTNLFDTGGHDMLAAHLSDMAGSRTAYNANGWQAALYRALAVDQRFCDLNWSLG